MERDDAFLAYPHRRDDRPLLPRAGREDQVPQPVEQVKSGRWLGDVATGPQQQPERAALALRYGEAVISGVVLKGRGNQLKTARAVTRSCARQDVVLAQAA